MSQSYNLVCLIWWCLDSRKEELFYLAYIYLPLFLVTKGRHELVPKDIKEEAEKYAKVSNSSSGNSHKSSLQHGLLSYSALTGIPGGGGWLWWGQHLNSVVNLSFSASLTAYYVSDILTTPNFTADKKMFFMFCNGLM